MGFAQSEDPDEYGGFDVSVSEIRAQVSPQFEIALPSGNIAQHFVLSFNNLEITSNLFYRVVDNNIGGELTFELPFGRFKPYITFHQDVDYENFVEPRISSGEVLLVPSSKYLNRQRGFTPGISYEFIRNLLIEPSITVNDIFKGNLTESRIVDEGVDLIPQISLIYDGIRVERDGRGFFFNGIYSEITYGVRYRGFSNPISSKLENRILASADIREKIFLEEELTFDTLVVVWEEQQIDFYSLGGFGSIRGYEPDSFFALRFFRSSLDIEQRIFQDADITITTSRKKGRFIRLHQFGLLYIYDLLVIQSELDLQSRAETNMGLGGGFSFTLSGQGNIQFKTQVYAAQAIGEEFSPVVYLRTSLFNWESRTHS
ncbi:MAG: hypothetical protein JSV89_03985 [Spirochaetaceae bacterium]|nr:MAG: hypothetical protein JSV89_03985 [Spirochaetaceae bacterium]